MADIVTHIKAVFGNDDAEKTIYIQGLEKELKKVKKIRTKLEVLCGAAGSKGTLMQAKESLSLAYENFAGKNSDGSDWGYTHDNGKTTVDKYNVEGAGTYDIKRIKSELDQLHEKAKIYLDHANNSIEGLESSIRLANNQ